MSIINDYKNSWALKQAEQSIHPYGFWLEMAGMLLENRRLKKLDLFIPLGNWLNDWDAFGLLSSINGKGMEYEKNQDMDSAFTFYEICVAENYIGSHPFDRLRIWYTKNKNYKDAMRVCQAYINLPNRPHGLDKPRFAHHLKRLQEKIDIQNRK